ncbi:AsmA-like C-terminal region [Succinivibrio dextrinosolvens]|uniref:hypothetical protein n=1 Tax=Succinivibrio dextrinosolvens TaxID=83771 RepID=UPI0008DFE0D3|nr:hypothetical protein [Succinivibrio dextrinosolvens]SFS50427.1 AsmA-like C-terminal region [Succinivibrio dextrinosolvens]
MAFKPNIYYRKQTPGYLKYLKIGICALIVVIAAVWGFILYFNGQHVKAPLLKFLSERTSFSINCDEIEFSPLYPDVLKLKKVTLGNSQIGEIYVEYDLKSVITSENLDIKYLYAKDITFDSNDLDALKKERFRYRNINILKLDLINGPLYLDRFSSEHADLSAAEVRVSEQGTISFNDSTLNAQSGTIDNHELKKIHAKILTNEDTVELSDLQLQVFGGTVFADLTIDKESELIEFSKLSFQNVIFQNYSSIIDSYNIRAKNASLSNCVLSMPAADLLLGQVSGKIEDLRIADKKITFDFKGKAGEISKPDLLVTAEDSLLKAKVEDDHLTLAADGKLFTGEYSSEIEMSGLNEEESKLKINAFALKNAKLEPPIELYNRLKYLLFSHNTEVHDFSIENTEFVSHIDKLPLSVKAVNLKCDNVIFDRESQKIKGTPGKFSLSTDSAYYSDLFIKNTDFHGTFSDEGYSVFMDRIMFYNSNATASISRDFNKNTFALKANAEDFDMSDLNSSLFSKLFNGKISFNIDLVAPENEDNSLSLTQKLNGSVQVKSKSLLISAFGLDLINGGNKKDYELNLRQLMHSIESGDCGFYSLEGKATVENGHAKLRISSDLATSHLTLKGNYNTTDRIIDVKSTLMSLAKDSLTSVIIRGHVTDPTFYITALLRGAVRPGIDESAIENEEYYTAEDGTVLKVKAKKLSDKPNIHASDADQVSIHSDDEKRDKSLTPDSVVLY